MDFNLDGIKTIYRGLILIIIVEQSDLIIKV